MIAEKRKKLGNKKLKNLTGIETRELKRTTSLRLEVAEIKQNVWRHYRDGNRMVKPAIPESRKKAGNQTKDTLIVIMERKRREERSEIEKRWEMLEDFQQHVEEEEAGVSTRGMEETKEKERIWAEEKTKKKYDRESKARAKGLIENQRLVGE